MSHAIETLLDLGAGARREGRPGEAKAHFSEAIEQCHKAGERVWLARALKELAYVERSLKQNEGALCHYREAAGVYQDLGDKLAWAHSLRHAADILAEQRCVAEAERVYELVLETYRARPEPEPLDLANALRGMAILMEVKGARENAQRLWAEARVLYQTAGVQAGVDESTEHLVEGNR